MANQTESEQYAFNAFANLPFYGSINSEFIELANVYDKKSIVDLGCGTGNITKLILKKLIIAKDSVIYAVDSSKSRADTRTWTMGVIGALFMIPVLNNRGRVSVVQNLDQRLQFFLGVS